MTAKERQAIRAKLVKALEQGKTEIELPYVASYDKDLQAILKDVLDASIVKYTKTMSWSYER